MSKPEVTPKGVFVYPSLTTPDTKFDAAGVYSVKLRLSADDAAPLIKKIEEALEAKVEEVKTSGKVKGKIKRVDPSYVEDEETGEVTFNFKMKASGKRKDGTEFTQRPTLKKFDLTDISPNTRIWGGSEGKVAFSLNPFHTALGVGVSLRLKGVQVIKLVSGSTDCGFEAEEDGEGFDDITEAQEFAKENSDDNESTPEDAGDAIGTSAQDF